MKKVLLTAAAAFTMFAMVACCNNKPAEEPAEECTAATEQCEHKCMHEGDSAMCCKAEAMADTMQCCKKAEGEKCCKKDEGKECCKKAEGKECEKKCEKAQ